LSLSLLAFLRSIFRIAFTRTRKCEDFSLQLYHILLYLKGVCRASAELLIDS